MSRAETLQNLLLIAIRANGRAWIANRVLCGLAFPGGKVDLEVFCAANDLSVSLDEGGLCFMDIGSPIIVEGAH